MKANAKYLEVNLTGNVKVAGALYYYSLYQSNLKGDEVGAELRTDIRAIIGYKKHGLHSGLIKKIIEHFQERLKADIIIPLPSSGTELNQLQKLFGEPVKRISPVERRKYNHRAEIDIKAMKESLQIDKGLLKGKTILLVDDILTSGKTILFYNEFLKPYCKNIKLFCLGLNYRLKPINSGYLPDFEPEKVKGNCELKYTYDFGDYAGYSF